MATVKAPPAATEAAAARVSSMGYADLYGAADDTGPGAAVAGSFGYVAATEPTAMPAAQVAIAAAPAGSLTNLGHQLLDSPAGVVFLIIGGLLLVLWHDLAK